MATPLELTQMMKVLQAEVTALRDRVGRLEAKDALKADIAAKVEDLADRGVDVPVFVAAAEEKIAEKIRKMCPKCGVKPAYFFHVKNCRADVA